MAKIRTLLKDELLAPKVEWDMTLSNPLRLALEWEFEPCPFDQRPARTPLFDMIVLSLNSVRYIKLIGVTQAFVCCRLANRRLRNDLRLNHKGPAVPLPHILPEFSSQAVGLKGVWIHSQQQKRQIASRVFSCISLNCEALCEIGFGGEHCNWRRELNPPGFICLFIFLASTTKTVNGYTLSRLFYSKKSKTNSNVAMQRHKA